MRGWKHVFYRIKVSFVFHFLRFKSKLHFTNRKLIDNCSLMDNIEFLLQLVMGQPRQKDNGNLSSCWPIYAYINPFGYKLIHSSLKLIDSGPEWTHLGDRLTHLSLFTLLSSKLT